MLFSRPLLSKILQSRSWTLMFCGILVAFYLLYAGNGASAQVVKILHSFRDGSVPNDGILPYAGLIQGTDGSLYGTTFSGGSAGNGTVFRIKPSGAVTILHSFGDGSVSNDGSNPWAGVIQAKNGDFYGTTENGGSTGEGTVFKITRLGSLAVVHSFGDGSVHDDGTAPFAALLQGKDGNLYGTTSAGGSANEGTVFKITSSGTLKILHSFGDGSVPNDGSDPLASLIEANGGNFYGTTWAGGATEDGGVYPGYGTVFEITPTGSVTILYSFSTGAAQTDGAYPHASLIQATDGNFYSTTASAYTYYLGLPDGEGTVFKMTPSGAVTILIQFNDGTTPASYGAYPYAALIQATDGFLYGLTYTGGIDGVALRITSAGDETVLHTFGSVTDDGLFPYDSLIQAKDGNFYGTTSAGGTTAEGGGAAGYGTVFKMSAKLLSLTLSPDKLTGGEPSSATIRLGLPAPTAGFTVKVRSSQPGVASVPSTTITVPAGATSATFTVDTTAVSERSVAVITASTKGVSKAARLTVKP